MADEENAYSFATKATRQQKLKLDENGFRMWRGGKLAEVTLAYES